VFPTRSLYDKIDCMLFLFLFRFIHVTLQLLRRAHCSLFLISSFTKSIWFRILITYASNNVSHRSPRNFTSVADILKGQCMQVCWCPVVASMLVTAGLPEAAERTVAAAVVVGMLQPWSVALVQRTCASHLVA